MSGPEAACNGGMGGMKAPVRQKVSSELMARLEHLCSLAHGISTDYTEQLSYVARPEDICPDTPREERGDPPYFHEANGYLDTLEVALERLVNLKTRLEI